MQVSTIGIDLAKNVFQVHGVDNAGKVVITRQLRRKQVIDFLSKIPACLVGMEACGTAHYWAREISKLGHGVRLMPPSYVKGYVKRSKNDAADAAAICEAVTRPSMRFVPIKSADQQSLLMLHRTRDLLIRQRTQLINALRGQLSEHGVVAPQGPANVAILAQAIDDMTPSLPLLVVELARVYLDQIDGLSEKVAGLEKAIACEGKQGAMTRRLQTVPGVGPITAMAIETFAPPMEVFRRGRDFAAWLGLVPVQHSTGGKQVLGKTSKMGQRDIRRLLIIGAMVIVRWACRKGAPEGTWLHRMLGRKPRMLIAIALANKMARSIWAMLTKGEDYRGPVAATL